MIIPYGMTRSSRALSLKLIATVLCSITSSLATVSLYSVVSAVVTAQYLSDYLTLEQCPSVHPSIR